MTATDESDIRRLVIHAGDQAPPMPEFGDLEARLRTASQTVQEPANGRGRKLAALVAVALVALVALTGWLQRGEGSLQDVATGPGPAEAPTTLPEDAQEPTVAPTGWPSDAWAVPERLPEGFEPIAATASGAGRTMIYLDQSSGETLWVTVLDAMVQPEGPTEEDVDVGDDINIRGRPGRLLRTTDAEGVATTTQISWLQDGLLFSLFAEGPAETDLLIAVAESIVPAVEAELPIDAIRVDHAGPGGDRFEVATTTLAGQTLTLQASTSTGLAFFFWFGSGGGGPSFLLPGESILAEASSGSDQPTVLSGLVDQDVASLTLDFEDGTTEEVPIQSRDLGYDVGFFLVALTQGPCRSRSKLPGQTACWSRASIWKVS